MASGRPGKCCFTGFRHEGAPQGEIISISDFKAYICRPKSDGPLDRGVVIAPDVFGICTNNQLLADDFADNGYVAILPDLFSADQLDFDEVMSGKVDLDEWLGRHVASQIVDPIVCSTIMYLRETVGVKRVAGAGYCFGGGAVTRLLRPGLLDVGYNAHPSYVKQEEVLAVQGPLAIAAAAHDSIFIRDLRHVSEDLLEKAGQLYQINLYGGVQHGFASRCDPKDPTQRWAKEQAFLQALAWYERFL